MLFVFKLHLNLQVFGAKYFLLWGSKNFYFLKFSLLHPAKNALELDIVDYLTLYNFQVTKYGIILYNMYSVLNCEAGVY